VKFEAVKSSGQGQKIPLGSTCTSHSPRDFLDDAADAARRALGTGGTGDKVFHAELSSAAAYGSHRVQAMALGTEWLFEQCVHEQPMGQSFIRRVPKGPGRRLPTKFMTSA